MLEWDFTVPAPAPVESVPDLERPEMHEAPPVSVPFRTIPGAIGDAMVYCVGCGDPIPLDDALTHNCDIPPAEWL